MIYQGSNIPILLEFTEIPTGELHVLMYNRDGEIKHWTNADLEYEGKNVKCPISQEESMDFPEGIVTIEIKLLDSEGNTIMFHECIERIVERKDKHIMGVV